MKEHEELYSFDEKPKRKRHEDLTTWANAFRAIGIFVGLVLVFGLIGNALYYLFLGSRMETYYEILGTSSFPNPVLDNITTFGSPIYVIITMLISIVFLVVAMLIIYGFIHLFATKLFKGDGSLPGLIVRGNTWTTGTYLAVSATMSIQSIILMNTIIEKFEGLSLSSYMVQQQYNEVFMTTMIPMYFIYGIAWLAWGIAMSRITARSYALDTSKGCGSLIMMNISLFVFFCGCAFTFGFVAASMLPTPA